MRRILELGDRQEISNTLLSMIIDEEAGTNKSVKTLHTLVKCFGKVY